MPHHPQQCPLSKRVGFFNKRGSKLTLQRLVLKDTAALRLAEHSSSSSLFLILPRTTTKTKARTRTRTNPCQTQAWSHSCSPFSVASRV